MNWCPINSRALIACRGRDPFEGAPVSGQYDWEYRKRDAARWAAFYEIPFVEPQGRVEFDSNTLALAAVTAKRLGSVKAYSRELFSAMFAEPTTRSIDRAECVRRATRCSVSESLFLAELESPATAKMHSDTLDTAYQLGIFGVPTFVAGTESYWGNDRLALLRHHLMRG